MGFYMKSTTVKAKLPRKRKKAAIKAQGRQWYHATIKMYEVAQRSGLFVEPVCKFWNNAYVDNFPVLMKDGRPILIPKPTRFW